MYVVDMKCSIFWVSWGLTIKPPGKKTVGGGGVVKPDSQARDGVKRDLGLGVSLNYRGSFFFLSLRLYSTRSILNSDWANLTFAALSLRPIHTRGFAPGACSRLILQAFSSSLNLPQELAPKHLTCWVSWSILRGGNSAPGDEVYPLNRWYTRRSFAPGVCAWSMLQEQISSCVSAFRSHRTGLFHAYWVIISCHAYWVIISCCFSLIVYEYVMVVIFFLTSA